MISFKQLSIITTVTLTTLTSSTAHRIWILPSTSTLSGENTWVTFDAAVSNDLFFPNHVALPTKELKIINPDGKQIPMQNAHEGELRSTFDLQLNTPGTFQVLLDRSGYSAFWKENDENKRWTGSLQDIAKENIHKKPDVAIYNYSSRSSTYVTLGKPNKTALKTSGSGLEFHFSHNHPNDLFANEQTTITLLMDGKPAPNLTVSIIKGNDRFRNDVAEIKATTNAKGEFTFTTKQPGRYWLSAEFEKKIEAIQGADTYRHASTSTTLEILPE